MCVARSERNAKSQQCFIFAHSTVTLTATPFQRQAHNFGSSRRIAWVHKNQKGFKDFPFKLKRPTQTTFTYYQCHNDDDKLNNTPWNSISFLSTNNCRRHCRQVPSHPSCSSMCIRFHCTFTLFMNAKIVICMKFSLCIAFEFVVRAHYTCTHE